MASLIHHQNPMNNSSRFQDSILLESRPKMLKDFLKDDCLHSYTKSSSNGFSMYPRKTLQCETRILPSPSKSNKTSMVLLRSKSTKVAATTISAFHKVINVVKFFPFASVKCPLALHKRVKRNFIKKSKDIEDISPRTAEKLKVKDILRWKSFRDLVEEKSTLVDFPLSPNQCTTITTTTTTTTTTSCSRRSSWCDSDFTAEDLPLYRGESEDFWRKGCLVGHHGTNVTLTNPKGGLAIDESEQQSPISVLESTFGNEIEGYYSPFRRALANFTNTIFVEEGNEIEEKATLLLRHVMESYVTDDCEKQFSYDLIFDYFMHELSTNEKFHDIDFEREILNTVKSWMNDELDECYKWEIENQREAYVKDLEKCVGWKVFKQEQEEISKALEINMLNELLDEILDDLIGVRKVIDMRYCH